MRYLVITDDADRHDIETAIGHLRAKRARACIASTRDEIDADIDELLDLWPTRPAVQPAS